MKLPRAEEAVVPRNKVENYLLHLGHPDGRGKAKFFLLFGFRREEWSVLVDALLPHASEHPVVESFSDADVMTYLVEGRLESPSGRKPRLRSVWLIEAGGLAPRSSAPILCQHDR